MMMKRLAGVLAGAALIGGLALAQQDSTPSTAGTEGPGIGGSGLNQDQATLNQQATKQAAVPGQATGQIAVGERTGNQLLGTVVESKSHTLYLQHMGAVVPLRVDKSTDLAGLSGKKLSDLKPGDEVQVSFQVKNKIDNVATKIGTPSNTGTGGSGLGTTSGSAGMARPSGEDTNVGKPVYPEEQPMKQPADPGIKHGTEDEKPLY